MIAIQTALKTFLCQILVREEGQDLVEYSMTVALIALGATAGMESVAAGINMAFSGVATTLSSNV